MASSVFRASWFWTANVFAAESTGLVGAVVVPAVILPILLKGTDSHVRWTLISFLGVNAVLLYLAYFPGNLGVFWPYAVHFHPQGTVTLKAFFKSVSIDETDIGTVERSLFWQGTVIRLRKPRGLLTQFVIPWYFGANREGILRRIQECIRE
jgi:hypothetical protein